jgi:parallel beta-helix repeat protein
MRSALAASVVVAVGWLAAPAFAEGVQCGQVVTHDVTLEADLDCSGDDSPALSIGAAGVTVDLGGHTLLDDQATVGIDNSGGYDDVTIRNGGVQAGRFATVVLQGASRNRLLDLDTGPVRVIGGERNRISRSRIGASPGDALTVDSERARVTANTVISGFSFGMVIDSEHGVIADNVAEQGGIHVDGSYNRIRRNEVVDAFTVRGIEVAGTGNDVARNSVLSAGSGPGILLAGGDGNVLRHNDATGGFHGIQVADGATGTLLLRNTANGNAFNGIDVRSASTILIRNTANDNGDFGIEAVPGVFGFGNRAAGNGNPLQCLNVRCR